MLMDKQGCKMDIDLEQTREYYQSHSLCDCAFCRNYGVQVKDRFPFLDAFLLELGVSVERPDELGCVEADNEVQYVFASYTVCGNVSEPDKYEMNLCDGGLPLRIVIGDSYVPNEQKADYFVLTVYGIVLPWVLSEPFPKADSAWRRLVNKMKAIVAKS